MVADPENMNNRRPQLGGVKEPTTSQKMTAATLREIADEVERGEWKVVIKFDHEVTRDVHGIKNGSVEHHRIEMTKPAGKVSINVKKRYSHQ